jgi:hypothetical protein
MDVDEKELADKVDKWFTEFEEEAKTEDQLRKEHKLKPRFNFFESNYLSRYALHCPKFKAMLLKDDEDSLNVLWEIKDFKRKLSRSGLESVNHLSITCKNCNGMYKQKACDRRVLL